MMHTDWRRELSTKDLEEVQKRFTELYQAGKQVEATSPQVDIKLQPDYLSEARFGRAQRTLSRYYTNISMASTVGLILLLQIECILVPLLRTGKSSCVVNLWDRYAHTAKYIKTCYEEKFFDESSQAWRYILLVRGMHQRIHKLMNDNNSPANNFNKANDDDDDHQLKVVWVNQYDMALTQFAFIGLFLLKPKLCAAHKIKQSELLDVVYFWRVLSYYLGIEDRFNIFAYDDNWPKQIYLLDLIMNEIYRKELDARHRQTLGTEMAKGVMLAFEDLSKELSFNILDHWWAGFISLSGKAQLEPYTAIELYKLSKFLLVFEVLLRSDHLRARINELYKRKFEKFYSKGNRIKEKLAKKYGHLKYEDHHHSASENSLPTV